MHVEPFFSGRTVSVKMANAKEGLDVASPKDRRNAFAQCRKARNPSSHLRFIINISYKFHFL